MKTSFLQIFIIICAMDLVSHLTDKLQLHQSVLIFALR